MTISVPDELEAQIELIQITLPNVILLQMADKYPAPQEWYDE
jgi:hypothetical protein